MKTRNHVLLWLTRNLPARAIDLEGKHYIERYQVFKAGRLEVLLHRYLGSDGDREVHDHPHRWSLGIPLAGGYTEERVIGFCVQKGWISRMVKICPWRWNWVSSVRFHRIAYVNPGTWTLFIRWDRFKTWSFARNSPFSKCVLLQQHLPCTGSDDWSDKPNGRTFRAYRGTE